MRGAVGRVLPGSYRTAGPDCLLPGAGPAPSVSEPQLLSLSPGPLSPPSEAVPGCGPPSRGGSGPQVTSVRASCAESAGERPWAAGWEDRLGAGRAGCGSGKPPAACVASGSLTALSRAFRPGGAVAGRRDFLPRPSRYPLGRGQEVMKKKQPSGRRGWALPGGEMALGPAGLSAVKGCRSEKRTGKSDFFSASRLLRNRDPHLGSSHRPLAP